MINAKKLPIIIREELEFTFPKEDWDKKRLLESLGFTNCPLHETNAMNQKVSKQYL